MSNNNEEKKERVEKVQKKEPYFHSTNVKNTKASEEKKYFTNIKKKTKAKKFTEEFIEKTKNNLTAKKTINIDKKLLKKVIITTLCTIVIALLGKEAFVFITVNEDIAYETTLETPWKGILYYDYLITKAKNNTDKASLYESRANALNKTNAIKYKTQIESDQEKSQKLNPENNTGEDKG